MRVEENREYLREDLLYFEFNHNRGKATYELLISFWPRDIYGREHTVRKSKRLITLPEEAYKSMFSQLWDPLELDDEPMLEFGRENDYYPHTLPALTQYLPTTEETKRWEEANSEALRRMA